MTNPDPAPPPSPRHTGTAPAPALEAFDGGRIPQLRNRLGASPARCAHIRILSVVLKPVRSHAASGSQ